MDSTLLTSIIAFSGVIISALISFGIAVRAAKVEITKVRYEIQHSKAEKLAEKRLEIYPTLYALLNKLNFSIQEKNLKVEELEQIYSSMYEWYLQNGIFLSSKSNNLLWKFIRKLKKLSKGGETAISNSLGVHKQRREYIKVLDSIEIEMKNEIGVYEVEYFDPNVKFSSYHELMTFYNEKNPEEDTD